MLRTVRIVVIVSVNRRWGEIRFRAHLFLITFPVSLRVPHTPVFVCVSKLLKSLNVVKRMKCRPNYRCYFPFLYSAPLFHAAFVFPFRRCRPSSRLIETKRAGGYKIYTQ